MAFKINNFKIDFYFKFICKYSAFKLTYIMNTELQNKITVAWGDDDDENNSSTTEVVEKVENVSVKSDDDGFFKVLKKKDKYKKEKKIAKKIEKLQKKQKDNQIVSVEVPFTFSKTNSISSETNNSDPSVEYKFTRPCNSLVKGDKCEKGLDCTFAHSLGQLKLTKCHFGSNCKNVICGSESVENANTGKVCTFLHEPIESLELYCKRVYGFEESKKSVLKSFTPKPYVGKPIVKPVIPIAKALMQEDIVKETTSEAPTDDKIVVDVPKDMAMQMLEMLVKSGKTNIELRIH